MVTESTTKLIKELEIKQVDLRERIILEQAKEKLNISNNEIVHYLKKAQLNTIEKMTKVLIKQNSPVIIKMKYIAIIQII